MDVVRFDLYEIEYAKSRHIQHMDDLCRTCKRVVPHLSMGHIPEIEYAKNRLIQYMDDLCRTCKRGVPHL